QGDREPGLAEWAVGLLHVGTPACGEHECWFALAQAPVNTGGGRRKHSRYRRSTYCMPQEADVRRMRREHRMERKLSLDRFTDRPASASDRRRGDPDVGALRSLRGVVRSA